MDTSKGPGLVIVKVCVPRHWVQAWEEGVGQGATRPVKRVSVFMEQAAKSHSDVTPSSCIPAAALQPTESQGGRVAPGLEGASQEAVHHVVRQARGDRGRGVAVDTADQNRFRVLVKLEAVRALCFQSTTETAMEQSCVLEI